MPESDLDETSLTVRATIDAPVDEVFAAFADADAVAEWYHPQGMTTEVDAWEPHEGGRMDFTMVAPQQGQPGTDDPGRYRNVGTFREVVDGERIVHTWRFAEGEDEQESVMTFTFDEEDEGTVVELTHEKLPDPESVEAIAQGWEGCLANLEAYVLDREA